MPKTSTCFYYFIVFVTGLCSANNWIEDKKYVPLPYGIPSHNTFGRVFSLICAKSFNDFSKTGLVLLEGILKVKRDKLTNPSTQPLY
jgi:hypothetical protein